MRSLSDAGHLAEQSGVRVRLRRERIPVAGEVRTDDAVAAALNDGEDFELLFTVSAEAGRDLERTGLCGTPVTVVGEVLAGAPGVTLIDSNGREDDLAPGGYEHFSR